ncbi:acpS [Symbiodinium necroappetens]|uniref:AcpS protein n=1 Tax=Symbiodinium necroappetens TaxID=1628268 RepID=A0A812W9K0_9DINO|nr:acpS [Symbiodinium necroappetens]
MHILAHGIDIVRVHRVQHSIEEYGEKYLARVFTDVERAYAEDRPRRRFEHYAVRFAAKEAALKCLGTGWSQGIAWTDVGVVHDANGAPWLTVTGVAKRFADELGVKAWHVSLSHTDDLAMASVIAEG